LDLVLISVYILFKIIILGLINPIIPRKIDATHECKGNPMENPTALNNIDQNNRYMINPPISYRLIYNISDLCNKTLL
jgi:hypothetical protein